MVRKGSTARGLVRLRLFGLDRVLEHITLISRREGTAFGLPRGRTNEHQPQVAVEARGKRKGEGLATGQRRILEHVLRTSAEKQLKMPR